MFPVTEFNFVVAGLATFAATVGYTASRRLSSRLSRPDFQLFEGRPTEESPIIEKDTTIMAEPVSLVPETTPSVSFETPVGNTAPQEQLASNRGLARQDSLKRKAPHDGFDDPKIELAYPHNLANLYPNKRSRTPPSESDDGNAVPELTPASTLDSIISVPVDQDIEVPFVSQDPQPIISTPGPEPPRTPSPVEDIFSPRPPSPTPCPPSPSLPTTPRPVFAVPTLPRPITPKPFASSSGGFAAFAGSSSPFATASKPQTFGSAPYRSIWASPEPTPNKEKARKVEEEAQAFSPPSGENALGQATPKAPVEKTTLVTGEEEEDVELELKNVKLFVRRGKKGFTDGMMGHVKVLSNRTSLQERVLFRREPLWKVSMNVRVNPNVRCTYVPEENVIKIILREPVQESSDTQDLEDEMVIYALRPGRSCPKDDFREFAETLSKSHFKSEKPNNTAASATSSPASS